MHLVTSLPTTCTLHHRYTHMHTPFVHALLAHTTLHTRSHNLHSLLVHAHTLHTPCIHPPCTLPLYTPTISFPRPALFLGVKLFIYNYFYRSIEIVAMCKCTCEVGEMTCLIAKFPGFSFLALVYGKKVTDHMYMFRHCSMCIPSYLILIPVFCLPFFSSYLGLG